MIALITNMLCWQPVQGQFHDFLRIDAALIYGKRLDLVECETNEIWLWGNLLLTILLMSRAILSVNSSLRLSSNAYRLTGAGPV